LRDEAALAFVHHCTDRAVSGGADWEQLVAWRLRLLVIHLDQHQITNASREPAISLHVYGPALREMTR